jgi:hypothetical protein
MSFTNFSDIARSKNQVVVVTHVATGKTVSFPAFITEYNDSYSVTWGEEQIFGRNDPIKPYQSTKRNMQIGFDVLSASFEEARENLRVKFVNMIQSADGDSSLLGCIEGLDFQPNKDAGYFVETTGELFPKHFNLSFRFTPQHESPLGWDATTREFITNT